MQEGFKQTENTKLEGVVDVDDNLSGSSRRRMSMRRSTSKGSSRRSFALCYDVPNIVEIHETEIRKVGKEIDDNKDLLGKKGKSLIVQLANLNKPEAPELLLGSLAACAHGIVLPVFGLLLSKSITTMYELPPKLQKDANFLALMFVGLGIVTLMVVPVQNYFFGVAGAKLIQRIRCFSFEKVVHQEISWFDDPKNSRYVNFFSYD